MTDARPDLDRTQRWMQAVITHPGGVAAGVASSEAQKQLSTTVDDLESTVSRSQARSSVQRLEVYANAYYARLLHCMRDFFPALVYALGEELFDQFAVDYLQHYPSTNYTLNWLADNFVLYLQQTRPEVDRTQPSAADWADFFIDLAVLEKAIDHVFDGPGVENAALLSPEDLAALTPENLIDVRLTTAPCLRLLRFNFPVNRFYTAYRKGAEAVWPQPKECWLALSRRDYVVCRYELSLGQYDLLAALVDGKTVGEAIAAAAAGDDDWDRLAEDLQTWFRDWAAEGLFTAVA